jgi:hypothetical protein
MPLSVSSHAPIRFRDRAVFSPSMCERRTSGLLPSLTGAALYPCLSAVRRTSPISVHAALGLSALRVWHARHIPYSSSSRSRHPPSSLYHKRPPSPWPLMVGHHLTSNPHPHAHPPLEPPLFPLAPYKKDRTSLCARCCIHPHLVPCRVLHHAPPPAGIRPSPFGRSGALPTDGGIHHHRGLRT